MQWLPWLKPVTPQPVARPQGLDWQPFRRHLQTLPEPVRQALTLAPLAAGSELLHASFAPCQALLDQLYGWRQGQRTCIALLGGEASGKSTLLNQALDIASSDLVCQQLRLPARLNSSIEWCQLLADGLELGGSRSLTDLIERLNHLSPRVIALDNLHALAGRQPGMQSLREDVCYTLLQTSHQHAWVLSASTAVWQRLGWQCALDEMITATVRLPAWPAEDFNAALQRRLQRLQQAGLTFCLQSADPGQEQCQLLDYHSLLEPLHQLSQGNLYAGLYALLSACQWQAPHTLLLAPLALPDLKQLRELRADDYLCLAEVFSHGHLRVSEHAELFQSSLQQSHLQLRLLQESGLLLSQGEGVQQSFSINPLYATALSRQLSGRNLLY